MLSQCTPLNLILQKVLFSTFVFWKEGNFRRNLKIFWCAPSFSNYNDFQSDFGEQFLNLSKFIILKRVYLSFFVEKIEELFQIFPLVEG